MNNGIMKFEEVMEYLDIGKSTLYNLLRTGAIASFKIGKDWKIPRQSVEDYINNMIQKQKSEIESQKDSDKLFVFMG